MSNYDGTLKFDTKIDESAFQKGASKLGSVAKGALGVVTKTVAAAAAGVTAFGASALKAGGDFSAGMSKVEAIGGSALQVTDAVAAEAERLGVSFEAGATDAQNAMAVIEAKGLDVARSSTFTAAEVADAYTYMGMAGWGAEQMLGGLPSVIALAEASGADLATTSDIVTDAMTAFNLVAGQTETVMRNGVEVELESTARFCDVLSAAATSSNTNVEMMGETFKYVAPVAGSMGYSIEDTAVAIGLMANSGIKASMAGTSLRSLMTRMAKPTKESAVAMDALGISLDDGEGNMLSFMEVMQQIRAGFPQLQMGEEEFQAALQDLNAEMEAGNYTEKEYEAELDKLIDRAYGAEGALYAEYAAMLAGKNGMSGLLAIVNASDEDFEKLTSAIDESNGRTEEMAHTMKDNLPGAIDTANSALDILKVKFEGSIEEPAKDAVNAVTDMINGMIDAFDSGGWDGLADAAGQAIQQLLQMFVDAAPKIVEVAVNLIHSFCESIKSADGVSDSAATLITTLVEAIVSVAKDLGSTGLFLVLELLKGITQALPDILASAVDLIGSFITGLTQALPEIAQAGIELLGKLTESIRENLPELIQTGMQMLLDFSGSLRGNFGLLVDAGLEMIMALADALIEGLPVFIETIPQIITNICGLINDNAPKLIASGIELIVKLALGLIQAIPVIVQNIPQIIQAIVSVFTAFNWIDLGKQIITALGNGIKALGTKIPELFKSIGTKATEYFKGISWSKLASDVLMALARGIEALAHLVPNALKAIGTKAVELFKGINWKDLGLNLLKGIAEGISSGFGLLGDTVKNMCSGILDGVKGFFGIHSPSTVMASQGDYLVQGMMESLNELPAQTEKPLQETLTKLKTWGANVTNTAATAITTMANKVNQIFGGLPGKIWTVLVNIVNKVQQWGANMLQRASTAITNMISKIVSLLQQLPGKVWTILVQVVTKVVTWGSDMIAKASTAITNMVSRITSILNELPGKIWTILVQAANKVITWGSDLAAKGAAAAQQLVSAVVNGVKVLPEKMVAIGKDIVNGLWNGISSGWSWLQDKVSNLAHSLLDSAKSALGIGSPSRAFRDEVGRWIMPGAVEGIEKTMPETLGEVRGYAAQLVEEMQASIAFSNGTIGADAALTMGIRGAGAAGTIVYADNSFHQNNEYQVPVATPSEVARTQREALRNMVGGVK